MGSHMNAEELADRVREVARDVPLIWAGGWAKETKEALNWVADYIGANDDRINELRGEEA